MENDMTTMTAGSLVAHPMTSYKDVTLQDLSPVTVPLSLFPSHHVNLKYNHHILCVQSITSY